MRHERGKRPAFLLIFFLYGFNLLISVMIKMIVFSKFNEKNRESFVLIIVETIKEERLVHI